jgi:hypothetical protein
MKSYAWVRIVTTCAVAACVSFGFAYVLAGGAESGQQLTSNPQRAAAPAQVPQPDTASPNWKAITDDLGIWVVKSDRGGMRGRLFVRTGNAWSPVAVDGEADILGLIPAGK